MDHLVASPGISHCLSISADLNAPWTPHLGLIIQLDVNPINIMGRQHRNPQQIPVCQGPDKLSWHEHK
eukprot:5189621-Heterocapsa_arctica.AAC.1